MKKAPVITIRGQIITAQQINGIAGKLASQSENITVWANYCAIHAVAFHNTAPLAAMLQNPAFKLASGKASKLGGEVLAYIRAHAPQIGLDAESGAPKVAKMGEQNPQRGQFQNPAERDENGKAAIVAPGDFALTFDEWRNLEKATKEKAEPKIKAATIAKKLAEVGAAMQAGKLVASAEELAELAEAAKALFLALDSQRSAEAAKAEPVDVAKAAELLKSGQGGKATRAGKKVAAV
jgi:hypothetical protein